jgi:hypothetical protein
MPPKGTGCRWPVICTIAGYRSPWRQVARAANGRGCRSPGSAAPGHQDLAAWASTVVTVTMTSNLAVPGTKSTAPDASSSRARGGVSSSQSTPSSPPAPCRPKITAVGPFQANGSQTVVIDGSCFGAGNTTSAADTAYFELSDLNTGWAGCWTDGHGEDWVTCDISSWTDHEVTFSGYTGYYGQDGFVVAKGDRIEVQVWNPQSGYGPATCQVVAGSGSATYCSGN